MFPSAVVGYSIHVWCVYFFFFYKGVFIVGAKRTPFGTFGGKIKDVGSVDLAKISAQAAIAQSKIDPKSIESVNVGNIIQGSQTNGPYISRHVALGVGCGIEVPCLTVNRLCGSGFQAVVNCAQDIVMRDAEISLAVGTESMSQAPFVVSWKKTNVTLDHLLTLPRY